MRTRYLIRHESGNDYEVFDTRSNQSIARGLSFEEAESAILLRIETDRQEGADYA